GAEGTEVRVRAADRGRARGTGAHREGRRRTQVGHFSIEQAPPLAALAAAAAAALPLLGVREALAGYAAFPAPAVGVARLRQGQQEPPGSLPAPRSAGGRGPVPDPRGEGAPGVRAPGAPGGRGGRPRPPGRAPRGN